MVVVAAATRVSVAGEMENAGDSEAAAGDDVDEFEFDVDGEFSSLDAAPAAASPGGFAASSSGVGESDDRGSLSSMFEEKRFHHVPLSSSLRVPSGGVSPLGTEGRSAAPAAGGN